MKSLGILESDCIMSDTYKFIAEPFESIQNRTWVGEMSKIVGNNYFRNATNVRKFPKPFCHKAISMKIPSDFIFIDAFSRLLV